MLLFISVGKMQFVYSYNLLTAKRIIMTQLKHSWWEEGFLFPSCAAEK